MGGARILEFPLCRRGHCYLWSPQHSITWSSERELNPRSGCCRPVPKPLGHPNKNLGQREHHYYQSHRSNAAWINHGVPYLAVPEGFEPSTSEVEARRSSPVELRNQILERGTGIEPVTSAWKAEVMPFYEPRLQVYLYDIFLRLSSIAWRSVPSSTHL